MVDFLTSCYGIFGPFCYAGMIGVVGAQCLAAVFPSRDHLEELSIEGECSRNGSARGPFSFYFFGWLGLKKRDAEPLADGACQPFL